MRKPVQRLEELGLKGISFVTDKALKAPPLGTGAREGAKLLRWVGKGEGATGETLEPVWATIPNKEVRALALKGDLWAQRERALSHQSL